jgi:hypothetical protein
MGQYTAMPEGFARFFSDDFNEVLKINLAIAELREMESTHAIDN